MKYKRSKCVNNSFLLLMQFVNKWLDKQGPTRNVAFKNEHPSPKQMSHFLSLYIDYFKDDNVPRYRKYSKQTNVDKLETLAVTVTFVYVCVCANQIFQALLCFL